jgi:dissimilatory sulfite reductase (desulfoviridin) alpha/beta subunit
MSERTLLIAVELSEIQAEALAQFVKRVGFSEFRQNAVDDAEAYTMRDAVDRVRKALGEAGYAPR